MTRNQIATLFKIAAGAAAMAILLYDAAHARTKPMAYASASAAMTIRVIPLARFTWSEGLALIPPRVEPGQPVALVETLSQRALVGEVILGEQPGRAEPQKRLN